ncbi:hypothetical protein jhhlp_006446, partial [Lomentospora prolificans]
IFRDPTPSQYNSMVPPPRTGSFSPNPVQTHQSGPGHPPHASQSAILSAAASPSTSSPIGSSSLTKIAITQVSLLLSTIKDESDPKYGAQVSQLRKLIDEHGMEVYSRFLTRLVAGNAPQIFPGLNRPVANPGNHHVLVGEMRKISHDPDQASKIAESIESGTEDIFRDFDLSSFMEHFKLDALEKTLLALAFKPGSRPDLKTKADAILSTNFPTFTYILSRPDLPEHADLNPAFVAKIVDRFIQYPPPNFISSAKSELASKVKARYFHQDQPPPSEVLAALDLIRLLADSPSNALVQYLQRTGADFTKDEETCLSFLQNRPANIHLNEDQVSAGLIYTVISQTPKFKPSVFTAALRKVLPASFRWFRVVSGFDKDTARISPDQFLSLYKALVPIARDEATQFDIQALWGGNWENAEAQLSFVCAFASLTPDQLDASTIPGLVPTISLDSYSDSSTAVKERVSVAVKHPLVSVAALSAVFHVALHSVQASQSIEAKRLFQDVVVPNLDIFVVSAFGVPKPWPGMAVDTLNSLFENFLYKRSPEYEFVLESLWKRDKDWVTQRLVDTHATKPTDLPLIFEHAVRHGWLEVLAYLPNGFGLDLASLAHAEGCLDLAEWARRNADRSTEMASCLIQFLMIKGTLETQFQRPEGHTATKTTTTLQVRTVSALLQILEDFMPRTPVQELIIVQRQCITAYPRLINYGEGYDDIIDANGKEGNSLPPAANIKMEEHYKKMYGNEIEVRDIVDVLDRYKHSRDPLEQDIFACMIHGLFDEYTHYIGYPLEALATTAVLFGGIISHKLISDLPLKVGLGMILESVRDHVPDDAMYKFGLQALIQLLPRFHEWPGFCKQLLLIPALQGTDAWMRAEEVIRDQDEITRAHGGPSGGGVHLGSYSDEAIANGVAKDNLSSDQQAPPFTAISVDPPPADAEFEDPTGDDQGKIQFVLNNITETTLQSMCKELRELLERRHQQWFASHLVEERAKMQPNYHRVYLELVNLFEDKALWAEVLRETYSSVSRMLNAESTMQNSTERTHLKNLGGWLGLLTLARNKPIKHRNIAFKKLLLEAHDTKRLVVVIPFVCKVLTQGSQSSVFRPPNPWLMDIIHLLIELYHHAELKLNLKFEIEVLCKGLNLDHKSIEPSGEILNRAILEESAEAAAQETLDAFEGLSLNGITPTVAAGLSSQAMTPVIPDIGPMINIPPTNEMVVNATRLHEIVRTALSRALAEIIQPVVDRSVTIAAISTQQMIHKDFAIEPDENRVRACAINMVKATAGSLALVTSKEPLRANFTNYMRNLSNDLPQGLPEGTIMMCVNSNLDLGCSIIEKQAEERAVPEIEEMIEDELESRRRHRAQKPMEPYAGPSLNRWASALPQPYRLVEGMSGLTPEQMAIYEDFARHPRSSTASGPAHAPAVADATTRSLANEVLQDQFSGLPGIPPPSETPTSQHMAGHIQPYPPVQAGAAAAANGRLPATPVDLSLMATRFQKLLLELQRVATEAREVHFHSLPRPHPVLDLVDALVQIIIKTSQGSEEMALFAADQISQLLFSHIDDSLALESLAHVLETLRKISGPAVSGRIRVLFRQQPGHYFLHVPLLTALSGTDLMDWKNIDTAMSKALQQRKEGSLEFLETLVDLALLNDRPLALHADFVRTLEAAWAWVLEDSSSTAGQRVKAKLTSGGLARPSVPPNAESPLAQRQDQMEYVFEEWIHLCNNSNATEKSMMVFLQQIQAKGIIGDRDDFFLFLRLAIDVSVDRFEQLVHTGGVSEAFVATDSLARLLGIFVRAHPGITAEPNENRPAFFESILALITLVLHHHHMKRGEHFNQRAFFRLLSMTLHEIDGLVDHVSAAERLDMVVKFSVALRDLGPRFVPGFTYGWLSLIQHRIFLPAILGTESQAGWAPLTRLICDMLDYLGEQLKVPDLTASSKEVYRSVLKFFVVLQHDYAEYVAANYNQLCWAIPTHCAQLFATVLAATPPTLHKLPEPPQQGLKAAGPDELEDTPPVGREVIDILQQRGVLAVLTQALQDGPSEAVLAHIVHSVGRVSGHVTTGFGFTTIAVDVPILEAIPSYVAGFAVDRAKQKGVPVYVPGSSDSTILTLLVRELNPEGRYYLISAMVNQLRFPNAHTHYFGQLLLDIFGQDLSDAEETEIRQQITRILLERLVGFWPQPWGLMVTVMELLKNEQYMFFDQPFIKSAPEVADRFMAVLRQ